jgi:hypothetical protein
LLSRWSAAASCASSASSCPETQPVQPGFASALCALEAARKADSHADTDSEPRAEQREALRERAVPARQSGADSDSHSDSEPRAEQREALRERAVPARRARIALRTAAQSGIRNAVRRRPLTLAGILANSGPRSRLRTNGRVASKHRFATLPEPSARRLRLWVRVRIQSRERSSAPALRERAVPPRQTGKAAHLAGLYNPARCSACGGLLRRLHRILVE